MQVLKRDPIIIPISHSCHAPAATGFEIKTLGALVTIGRRPFDPRPTEVMRARPELTESGSVRSLRSRYQWQRF